MLDIASEAASFASHNYWRRMTVMLNGMINAEFEEMLNEDGKRELNRASIAVARKMLRMPFIDIQQGKAAVSAVERHAARSAKILDRNRRI